MAFNNGGHLSCGDDTIFETFTRVPHLLFPFLSVIHFLTGFCISKTHGSAGNRRSSCLEIDLGEFLGSLSKASCSRIKSGFPRLRRMQSKCRCWLVSEKSVGAYEMLPNPETPSRGSHASLLQTLRPASFPCSWGWRGGGTNHHCPKSLDHMLQPPHRASWGTGARLEQPEFSG